MYVDTHAHFDHLGSAKECADVIGRARAAGLERIVAVGANAHSNRLVARLAQEHPDIVAAAVGYDREQAEAAPAPNELRELLQHPRMVAVGEIGVDYHYSPHTAPAQRKLFAQMLDLAAEAGRPVIVHSRDAEADTLAMLTEWARPDERRTGVLHCFTGSAEFAERLVELGFYIGFSGIVTFRNAQALRGVAARLPLDRIVLETDSPYLAPAPFRGTVNEPARVVHVAECLAQIRHDSVERIAHITSQNAKRLFHLSEGATT
jgi:TatD DNase family protein